MNAVESAIFESGVRWANNILSELSNNYDRKLSKNKQAHLHLILRNIHTLLEPDGKEESNAPGGKA